MANPLNKDSIDVEVALENQTVAIINLNIQKCSVIKSAKIKACCSYGLLAPNKTSLCCNLANKSLEEVNSSTAKQTLDLTKIENEELNACRICLGSDEISNLITPCACTGTQKYVHEECLKTWLLNKKEEDLCHCEICQQLFNMNFKVTSICLPFRRKTICKAWVPLLTSVVLLFGIVYITYLSISAKSNDTYIIISALILAFLCLACCLTGLVLSTSVCFERKIETWLIELNKQ